MKYLVFVILFTFELSLFRCANTEGNKKNDNDIENKIKVISLNSKAAKIVLHSKVD